MEDKLKDLFEKIKLEEKYLPFFSDFIFKNVIVREKDESWTFILEGSNILDNDIYFHLEDQLIKTFVEVKKVRLEIVAKEIDYSKAITYFEESLKKLKTILPVADIFSDNFIMEENSFFLEVFNQAEEKQVKPILKALNYLYKCYGFDKEFNIRLNENKREEIINEIKKKTEQVIEKSAEFKTDFKEDKPKVGEKIYTKKETDPNCILGRTIKDNPTSIKNLIGEDNSMTIKGEVFGVDFFESSRSDFKIITLKVTDFTDSVYVKVFVKDKNEYLRLCKELKVGLWFLIRGYTKNDTFAKDLVLNARDIVRIDKENIEPVDKAEIKRVELHTHTKFSQMDGLIEDVELIKRAIKWGHRGIAITDHNGCQGFPHVYNYVKDHNKKIESEDDKFKVGYGVELTLVDDTVDIVIRGNDFELDKTTFVVFDFETTGFNAGGKDSIIEVGAVKICNGEIIDKFSELIDPKRKLPSKITEITGITDQMLVGKETEENAIKKFIDFFEDLPMVAHNAKFDTSFLEMAYQKYNLGKFENTVIDTLKLSQTLDNTFVRHSLSAIVKRYEVVFDESSHHRADYDAEATAYVFNKMIKKMIGTNIKTINQMNNLVSKDEIHKYGVTSHVNVIAVNDTGRKNLYKLISLANTKFLYKTPRIIRSELEKLREGLIIGSGCYESEVFRQALRKEGQELVDIINYYDYVEVQPPECYRHMLDLGDFETYEQLLNHIKKIISYTKEAGKIIVATSDAHHLDRNDKIFREIIINQKVPGGGLHPLSKKSIKEVPSNHFRTTDEMLEDFSFLDKDLAYEIVVENSNKILDSIEHINAIVQTNGVPFSPKIENSEQIVNDLVYSTARGIYGNPLPTKIEDRIKQELVGIIKGGYDVIYLISQKLVKKSNDNGYLVGSRGSVGSSFVATMMGITEVNPLPAHYVCPNCKHTEFEDETKRSYGLDYSSGYDLPNKDCPKCNIKLSKEGQDMPFATFLGFNADKVPDIDLNFSGEYQAQAHEYTKELFGEDYVYRAGTVSTVADKTAFGYVKGYCEDKNILNMRNAEIERIAMGCVGVKRTTGQHPGGIVVVPDYKEVCDITPFQYPSDDVNATWKTTHFEYHAIEDNLLKLDILGHDDPTMLRMLQDLSGIDVTTLPFDDPKIFELLSGPEIMGVSSDKILCKTGTLGLPELGTKFVIQMLEDTKPKSFTELVKISGLSHGTDVWIGNASELIRNNIVPFKDVIGCRDDIMVSLINWGIEPFKAFKIMELVRKGKASKDPEAWNKNVEIMKESNIPDWYIDSCYKIKYMFPKAHAVAYVMSALRIAWFKLYRPIMYYSAYFSIRVSDFDIETMIKGYDAIKAKIEELQLKGYDASNKESSIIESLKIALEATARGFKFSNISLESSDSKKFLISETEENTLIPPFLSIDGLGMTVATNIIEERDIKYFLSIEDFQKRGKVSSTLIEKMKQMKILNDLPESSQITFF